MFSRAILAVAEMYMLGFSDVMINILRDGRPSMNDWDAFVWRKHYTKQPSLEGLIVNIHTLTSDIFWPTKERTTISVI